jgi:hypothetical protein
MDTDSHNVTVPIRLPERENNANEGTFGPPPGTEQNVPERNNETTDDTQPVTEDVVRDQGAVAVGGIPPQSG